MNKRATALTASIALHLAIVGASYLFQGRQEPGLGVDATMVRVSLLPGIASNASDGETTVQDDAADGAADSQHIDTAEPAEESLEANATEASEREAQTEDAVAANDRLPQPTNDPAERVAASGPQPPPMLPQPAPEQPPGQPPPEPPQPTAATQETRQADTAVAANDTIATEAKSVSSTAVETQESANDTSIAEQAAERAPNKPEPRIATAMSVSEQSIVTHEIRRWSESFVALAEWQPTTTWHTDGQDFTASVARLPSSSSTGIEEALVTVKTTSAGQTLTTQLRMHRLGFSHFAQFIDRWDDDVQIHDDQIDGRFHSNSEIFVSRSNGVQPMFLGKVTTARDINTSRSDRRVRQEEIFLGGLETRVNRIVLPRPDSLFNASEAINPAHMQRFAEDTRIEFHSDGRYSWQPVDASRPIQFRSLGDQPYYLIADQRTNLHLHGIVKGQVLVYSPHDIIIVGNLTYPEHPVDAPDSTNYLGLVSNRSIEIAAPEVTGRDDLHVHAAIYAKNRFAVRNYFARTESTLFVHGSLTAGSLTATEPRFRTKLSYDRRFETMRPPRFPMTDRYEITEWDEQWIAE